MKSATKFVGKGLVFIFLSLLLFLFLNGLFEQKILSQKTLSLRDAQFEQYNAETTLLFMGDSHTEVGLHPSIIENSFNYGTLGENYIQTYYKLETLLSDDGFDPGVLILPYDLHSFSSYRTTRVRDGWYWKQYMDFFAVGQEIEDYGALKKTLRANFPLIGGGNELFLLFLGADYAELVKGYSEDARDFSSQSNRGQLAQQRVDLHFKDKVLVDEHLFSYFKRTIALAQDNDIQVVLVKFPVTTEYLDAVSLYIPNTDQYYEFLEQQFDVNSVIVLDYQTTYESQVELFSDSNHLNGEGSVVFSEDFRTELVEAGIVE